MVDQITEIGSSPVFVVGPEEKRLEKAVSSFSRDLRKDLSTSGELSLDELLNKVLDWENEHGEKLSDDEFEVLTILSLVLGTTKTVIEKSVGSKGIEKFALEQSVQTQQEITKIILSNLDENGKPDRGTAKMFSLVTEIFEEYFNPETTKMTTPGAAVEGGLWQGIQGMVTTALLLKESGWDVRFPPKDYDIKYEIDLMAKSDSGDIFAVDVTAKTPKMTSGGRLESSFYAEKRPIPRFIPRDVVKGVTGFIRINVPPLRHHSSRTFYSDRMVGFPAESSVESFKQMVR